MSANKTIVNAIDPDGQWLYRVGGFSAGLLGIAYLVIMALYIPAGAPPTGAEARLAYLSGNAIAWWAILGLSVLTDLLFIPVAFALYFALKAVHRDAMLIATAFVGLFVILDLAVTWTNYAALITLAGEYAVTTSAAQRAVLVAAAMYPTSVLESGLFGVYAILVPSIGILVTGLVMLKGIFGKSTAYAGLGSGILGIVSVIGAFFVSALGTAVILASVLTTVWVLMAGYRLYRLGSNRFQSAI